MWFSYITIDWLLTVRDASNAFRFSTAAESLFFMIGFCCTALPADIKTILNTSPNTKKTNPTAPVIMVDSWQLGERMSQIEESNKLVDAVVSIEATVTGSTPDPNPDPESLVKFKNSLVTL